MLKRFFTSLKQTQFLKQPAALRLVQLLANSVDNGADAGDEAAAQAAVLNNLASTET
jgi:hypothetical protein